MSTELGLLSPEFAEILKNFNNAGSSTDPKNFGDLVRFMMAPQPEVGNPPNPENDAFAAGLVYLGQLISHDISFHRFLGDVSPSLRLRTLYGSGPGTMPFLYKYKPLQTTGLGFEGAKIQLDTYKSVSGATVHDIPRHNLRPNEEAPDREDSIPLLADARNDQNFILSQLLVAFARLHNYMVDFFRDSSVNDGSDQLTLFQKASAATTELYQSAILHDYLPRLLYDPSLIGHLTNEDHFIFFQLHKEGVKVPLRLSETFARAAFRFGHSQVSALYKIAKNTDSAMIFSRNATLDLRGFVRDKRRSIDWSLFFGKTAQGSKQINHMIALPLRSLPFLKANNQNLAAINLRRSRQLLPNGLALYKGFLDDKKKDKLTAAEAAHFGSHSLTSVSNDIDDITFNVVSTENLPLWLFILLEAEVYGKGKRLGPLGSRIVAEQIMWTLLEDKKSILHKPLSPALQEIFPEIPATLSTDYKPVDVMAKTLQLIGEIPEEAEMLSFARTRSLDGDTSGNGYKGTELRPITLAEFQALTLDARSSVKRLAALLNGHYDMTPRPNVDYIGLILSNQYSEPGGPKQLLKVYVSRKAILYHLGIVEEEQETAPEIGGLLFQLGLLYEPEPSKIELVVFPVNSRGEWLDRHNEHTWYFSDVKQLVQQKTDNYVHESGATGTAPGGTFNLKYATLIGNFITDCFSTLKNVGMPQPVIIKRNMLLGLLGLGNIPGNYPEVEFHLSIETGQRIIDGQDMSYPLPPEDVSNQTFFNLALKSAPAGNAAAALYSSANRPYPIWCYFEGN